MDSGGYGRYVDGKDGLPRWRLPPLSVHNGTRWKCIEEAIRELYPNHGARFVAERLGMPTKYRNISRYASLFRVRKTEEGRRKAYEEMKSKLRRIFKMERARVMGGLPQLTRVRLGWGGVGTPRKLYALRHKLVKEFGYYYCENDLTVLLYDGKTKRRLPGTIAPNGFTEEDITEKYGMTFEYAGNDGEECEDDMVFQREELVGLG